jgi:excisionase family DNA binding protein
VIDAAFRTLVNDAVADAVRPLAVEVARLRDAIAEKEQPWVSRREAATRLGCSVDTVDRQISAGTLQVQRIGARGVRVRLPATPEASAIAALAAEARRR